jgi:non-homologous end joining protein Ku
MLTPQKEAVKQYFLLLKILTVENKSLVIEFVMRKKIHLGIIKPIVLNGMSFLLLKEILYSDKIKPIEPLKEEQITEEELKLGRELIELVSQKVENKKYEEIRDKRIEILQKILSGEVKPQEIKTDETQALVEQLKKSVETSKSSQVKKPVRRKVRTNG